MAGTIEGGQKLKLTEEQWSALREELVQYVRVDDGHFHYEFRCQNRTELWRARTLKTKEAGTLRWIHAEVRSGDVFYDVGANVGLYTLMAGQRVGSTGMVYAFEPHVGNVDTLLHNVSRNGLAARVKILSCALNDREGFFDFNYFQAAAGSSMSQLGGNCDAAEQQFRPAASEYKFATTVDRLIDTGAARPPDHVKLDVDGNELLILRGMQQLLVSGQRPRTVQVEINARYKRELFEFMHGLRYELTDRHHTAAGEQALAQGHDVETIAYNAIFKPRA